MAFYPAYGDFDWEGCYDCSAFHDHIVAFVVNRWGMFCIDLVDGAFAVCANLYVSFGDLMYFADGLCDGEGAYYSSQFSSVWGLVFDVSRGAVLCRDWFAQCL